jgi:hypothetical protein
MKLVPYELPDEIRINSLLNTIASVDDALARLDERIRTVRFRDGLVQRLLYGEACASTLADGVLIHLEDLVLLDGHAYSGPMFPELSSCLETLKMLRMASTADPAGLLLSPRPGEDCEALPMLAASAATYSDPYWSEAERLEKWRAVVRRTSSFPPLLAAAIAWDAWLTLLPDQYGAWRAPMLAAVLLRARSKTRSFLLPIVTGRRFGTYLRHDNHDFQTRIAGFIEWAEVAVDRAAKELKRLTLADEMLRLKLKGRRSNSRLPALVDLLLSRPLVSVPMAAKALRCSPQAVEAMFEQLGSIPRELSGRKRYRVWSI